MRTLLCCLLLSALGCAGPRPAKDAPVRAEATDFFCRYRLNPWYLPGAELRLKPDEAPFASFERSRRAGVTLVMPYGAASQGMDAVFTSGWVTFRAHYLPTRPFPVSTRVPLRFGEVLRFEAGATVKWLGSDAEGRMLVEREPPQHYRPARALRTALRCEDTTIGTDFPTEKRPAAEKPRRVELALKVEIPVSPTPGGAAEGHLRYDEEWGRAADLLEEQADHLRIRKRCWPGIVEGWIPRAHASALEEKDGMGGIFGALTDAIGSVGEGRGTPNYPRCAAAVPLGLARGGELATVGEVRKGAAVLVKERLPGWTVIALPELDWMRLAPGASWAVANEDLAKCLPAALEAKPSAK